VSCKHLYCRIQAKIFVDTAVLPKNTVRPLIANSDMVLSVTPTLYLLVTPRQTLQGRTLAMSHMVVLESMIVLILEVNIFASVQRHEMADHFCRNCFHIR
jgi:hypothetical protein